MKTTCSHDNPVFSLGVRLLSEFWLLFLLVASSIVVGELRLLEYELVGE